MKVIGFNGSPRKDGNTRVLIDNIFVELNKADIETELVHLADKEIHGCLSCYRCFANKDKKCAVKNDAANEYIDKMMKAQGIILGSPVYFIDVSAGMKAFIERTGFVSRANGGLYRNKVGASVASFRRSGGVHAIDSLNHFLLSSEMIIAGRATGIGMEKGQVAKDEEGMQLARSLGQRMAWLLRKLYS